MMSEVPIWVINLVRDKERLNFMQQQLQGLGLDFEIIEAIDGNALSEHQLEMYSEVEAMKSTYRPLSNGEIGCALSHLKCYERMLEKNIQYLLILEDDVIIGEELLTVIKNKNKLPKDFELINFYTTNPKLVPITTPIFSIYCVAKFMGPFANGTAGGLITSQGAKKLLKAAYPIRMPADNLTGKVDITGLTIYGIYPQVVSLKGFETSIKDRRPLVLKHPYKENPLKRFIRLSIRFFKSSGHYYYPLGFAIKAFVKISTYKKNLTSKFQ